MTKRAIGIVPGGVIFIYLLSSIESVTASKILGIVALALAFGSICFFAIASPYGLQQKGRMFGKEVKYLAPVPTIPGRLMLVIIGSTVLLALAAFGFFLLGY